MRGDSDERVNQIISKNSQLAQKDKKVDMTGWERWSVGIVQAIEIWPCWQMETSQIRKWDT